MMYKLMYYLYKLTHKLEQFLSKNSSKSEILLTLLFWHGSENENFYSV